MRPARIVLATIGSLGDLHPMLALARELRRRGHRAELATSELYREKIGALGFPFHPLRPDFKADDSALVRAIMDGPRGSKKFLRDLMFPAVRDMFADLERAAVGADLLVSSEAVFAAPLLAEHRRLRWASTALGPLWFFSLHDPPIPPGAQTNLLPVMPPAIVRAVRGLAKLAIHRWWAPVRALRRELGLPPGRDPLFEQRASPQLDLALFSPAFAAPQRDWPARTVQTGFCFYDEEETTPTLPPAVEAFLAAGPAPIVFTLGSAAVLAADDFYHESARAAQQLNRRALLLIGKNPPPPDLPPWILAWGYLPFAAIFPRAAAIVHQGGVGTTAQALRAGRPVLVVPFSHDQFDNAARVTRLGVGRTVPRPRYSAKRVARELAALLDSPDAAARAVQLGGRVSAERGTVNACDALERVLA